MLASVLIAALCAGILQLELLHRPDSALADALYQRPKTANSDIMLISIDQKSLDELGPFVSWGRALMGDVIEILNEQPEYQPAVIEIPNDIPEKGQLEIECRTGDENLADGII